MTNRTYILLIILIAFSTRICAQQEPIYVIGDNVNVRIDTISTKRSNYQVDWGTKFQGEKTSKNWYSVYMPYVQKPMFISSRFILEKSEFLRKAENKEPKNGKTKLELMIIYLENEKSEKAEELLINILNNNSNELYRLEGREWCVLLGPYSYQTMLESITKTVDYQNPKILTFTDKVINGSSDSLITAIALTDQSKYYLSIKNINKAEEILFQIILDYSSNLFIPVPCEYDYDGKIYPLVNMKNTFYSMFHEMKKVERERIYIKLKDLSNKCNNSKSKEIIDELYSNLTIQTEN